MTLLFLSKIMGGYGRARAPASVVILSNREQLSFRRVRDAPRATRREIDVCMYIRSVDSRDIYIYTAAGRDWPRRAAVDMRAPTCVKTKHGSAGCAAAFSRGCSWRQVRRCHRRRVRIAIAASVSSASRPLFAPRLPASPFSRREISRIA